MFNQKTGEWVFHAGPVFAEIVLADEINRASPKTQSALLEVMEEAQVTVDGVRRPAPTPFMVIATQNPVEQEGTYKLPEAQLDRFLLKVTVDYPSADEELEILRRHQERHDLVKLTDIAPVLTRADVQELRRRTDSLYVEPSLLNYIVQIVRQTRLSKAVYLGRVAPVPVSGCSARRRRTPACRDAIS